MICGITIGEYIRNRRLTLAAHDLMISDETVLDIALKYRYESPDSFSKAFYRFHNVHPSEVRRDKKHIKGYAPLQLTISLRGGFLMDYRIERKEEFKVIANLREFFYEGCQEAIPQFWQEHYSKGLGKYICGETTSTLCKDEIYKITKVENGIVTKADRYEIDIDSSKSGVVLNDDDDGVSYILRGRMENNYVSFAGSIWRVVRINGDGSIRVIK